METQSIGPAHQAGAFGPTVAQIATVTIAPWPLPFAATGQSASPELAAIAIVWREDQLAIAVKESFAKLAVVDAALTQIEPSFAILAIALATGRSR